MNHDPLRVYVAGASVERAERAIPAIRMLREAGVAITHDWTVDIDEAAGAANSDADVPEEVRHRCAMEDARGVSTADYVLLLAPNERGSSGAWVELGLAIGLGVPVLVAGPKNGRTIFTSLAAARFATDAEAIQHVVALHRGRTEAA